jgi:excinuclease UvrABC nuclease subunit
MDKIEINKLHLPDAPGVYFFKQEANILYIGKATSLRDRVRSYFAPDVISTRGSRIVDMVTRATTVEWTETQSVLEALILEANLIKKHQPPANVREKDNKSYSYVVITKETMPRILIKRGRDIDFAAQEFSDVYGPFPSRSQLEEALRIIRKIFPFIGSTQSSRIYEQMGLAPHQSDSGARARYKDSIRNIKLFLRGKTKTLLSKLEKDMYRHAAHEAFEEAEKKKRQLFALTHIRDVSLLETDRHESKLGGNTFRIESYDIAHLRGRNSVGVMTVVLDNDIEKSQYKKFLLRDTKKGDDIGGLTEIVTRRLKHAEWGQPDLLVIDGGKAQRNAIARLLQKLGQSTPIVSVVKDEAHKPREILGDTEIIKAHERAILLANNEAHRFAITFHRQKERKTLKGLKK